MSVAGEVEKRNALVLVGFVGVLMPFDFALAAVLLLAPLVRHFFVEGGIHQPVELVDIHGVDAILKPLELGLVAPDRLLVLAAFVGVAGMQRIAYLRAYESASEARNSIGRYLDFYNRRRPHSSLDDMTPDQAYFDLPPLRAAA